MLEQVYRTQSQRLRCDDSVLLNQSFKFIHSLPGLEEEGLNFVDEGPASDIRIGLAICEFDATLKSSLNFSDPECFKALVLPLGLEELRAIVAYEVMHLQLLIVATRTNQVLLDNSLRKACELRFLDEGFAVANPVLNVFELLQGQNLLETNARRLPKQELGKLNSHIDRAIGDHAYNIQRRKD